MSAVMCVALKSRVTSPGVLFVNWTIVLLVRRLSRLKSAGCAAELGCLRCYLVAKQVEVQNRRRQDASEKECKSFYPRV